MKRLYMRWVLMLSVLLVTIGAAGCNTMEGFGEDMKTLGEKIEKKAGDSDNSGGSSDY